LHVVAMEPLPSPEPVTTKPNTKESVV